MPSFSVELRPGGLMGELGTVIAAMAEALPTTLFLVAVAEPRRDGFLTGVLIMVTTS